MRQVNFLDKVKTLIEVTSTSPYFIGVIILFVLLAILFITTNKRDALKSKIIYGIIYILCIGILLFVYNSSIKEMIDNLINNIFIFFYFPNLAAYFLGIIITNIILWKTVLSENSEKVLKVINSIIYCLLHYIFILILNVITTNKLDILSQESVYQNREALSLIGLSSTIFVVWIIFITIHHLVMLYQNRGQDPHVVETIKYVNVKRKTKINSIEFPRIIHSDIVMNQKKQSKIELVLPPLYIYSEKPVGYNTPLLLTDYVSEVIIEPYIELEPIIKNIETVEQVPIYEEVTPIIKDINTNELSNANENVILFDSLFTIEEYKTLLQLLKTKKEYQMETKEEYLIPLKRERQNGFTELESLYRKY